MIRKCLKCGESNPDATGDTLEACPKCGAIYTKVEAAQKVIEEKRRVLEEANARKAAADAKAAEARGCPGFCVNGPQAGNCHLTRRHNDYVQA